MVVAVAMMEEEGVVDIMEVEVVDLKEEEEVE